MTTVAWAFFFLFWMFGCTMERNLKRIAKALEERNDRQR